MTFELYIYAIADAMFNYPEWRYGQTAFNLLYTYRPDLALEVTNTDLDPFHNEDNLIGFFNWVESSWNDGEHKD